MSAPSFLCFFSILFFAAAQSNSGPGAGPWEHVKPEEVGLSQTHLDEALAFINQNVKARQCFLLIKDGKMAYEWYQSAPDPADTPVACDVAPIKESGHRYAVAQVCTESPGQKGWQYNAALKQVKTARLENAIGQGLDEGCLDASDPDQLKVTACNAFNPAQHFTYNEKAKWLIAANGDCVNIDDGVGPAVNLDDCDGEGNQQFEFKGTSLVSGKTGDFLQNQRCLEVTTADPQGDCSLGVSFGCEGNNSMWVKPPCYTKQFWCNGRQVQCVPMPDDEERTLCGCDLENKPHEGYSMTKSIGAYIIFLSATHDGLDIDADITTKYGLPSPKVYGVTSRMMMSNISSPAGKIPCNLSCRIWR